jgi:hypothetical protein
MRDMTGPTAASKMGVSRRSGLSGPWKVGIVIR